MPVDTCVPDDVAIALRSAAAECALDVVGGKIRRSSSRFCLGVEHGDYNGTDLFGVGTDRFIWIAFKPNTLGRFRLFSCNAPQAGIVDFRTGEYPENPSERVLHSWARFPYGANAILQRAGYPITCGMDAVIYGNIPGGGMSRSASLSLNLLLTMLEVNGITETDGMRVVELAQQVENDYIGSPCGNLDQIMIYFAQSGMGTYYSPRTQAIQRIPLGASAESFRLVSLDTGTDRPGLDKSTYKTRRAECEAFVALAGERFGITCLGDVDSDALYQSLIAAYGKSHPAGCRRLKYIYQAQRRFEDLMTAWKLGDIQKVGAIFRDDGYGLRDDYEISGPELEAMNEIARSVDGVFGERMLGGGDKGASGAIVRTDAVRNLHIAVAAEYPRRCPDYANRFAVHACRSVDGIVTLDGLQ